MEEDFLDVPMCREFVQPPEFTRLPDESTVLRVRLTGTVRAECNTLVYGQETVAFGDAGRRGIDKRSDAKADVTWYVAMRPVLRCRTCGWFDTR